MKDVLGEIQSGAFAREWIAENRAGQENFQRMREEGANHQIEREGKELRSMMDWIDTEFHAGCRLPDGGGCPTSVPSTRLAAAALRPARDPPPRFDAPADRAAAGRRRAERGREPAPSAATACRSAGDAPRPQGRG